MNSTPDSAGKENSYHDHYFYDLIRERTFIDYLKGLKQNHSELFDQSASSENNEPGVNDDYDVSKGIKSKSGNRINGKQKANDNIDNILVSGLVFRVLNYSYTEGRESTGNHDLQVNKLKNTLKEMSLKTNLSFIFLEALGNSITTESFVEYCKMRDWLTERMNNDTMVFLQYFAFAANDFRNKYGIKRIAYFKYDYFQPYGDKGVRSILKPAQMILFLLYIPHLAYMNSKDPQIFTGTVRIMNLEKGNVEYMNLNSYSHRMTRRKNKKFIYNQLRQLKSAIH